MAVCCFKHSDLVRVEVKQHGRGSGEQETWDDPLKHHTTTTTTTTKKKINYSGLFCLISAKSTFPPDL
jgi:hypothetical protein